MQLVSSARPRAPLALVGLLASSVLAAACASKPQSTPVSAPPSARTATTTATATKTPAKAAVTARPAPRADQSLLPRKLFSGNPSSTNVQVSPDAKWLSWIAPVDGVLNVWIAPIDAPEKASPLTNVRDRPLRTHSWSYDSKLVIFPKDSGGNENFHLYAVDVATKALRDLTDLPNVRANLVALSPKKPKLAVVALNDRDPKAHDLYTVELATGKRTLLSKNERGFLDQVVDEDFAVRLAVEQRADGGSEIFEKTAKDWKSWAKVGLEDALTTEPWAFDASGKTLYFLDSRERDTAALFAIDWKSGKKKLLAEDTRADVEDGLFEPKTGLLQAVAINFERRVWKVLDPKIAPDLEALQQKLKGDLAVSSRSLDDKQWVVTEIVDDGSPRFFRWDRAKKALTFLFAARKELEGVQLSKMKPVVIESRDGLGLVSYLTLPRASDPDGDGVPSSPLPMVLLVHGGPWARDRWGYSSVDQWLASRGYAVLRTNFRGSTGFGKRFLNAGNGEWAGKMHDDLLDAVSWAVKSKVAAPEKVAIMGGSYGGYATLVGLTFTPDTFACGVDIVGPSNIATLLSTIPPYWAPMVETFTKRVGDHRTEEGKKLLASRSPLSFADRIKRPLLIGQGANDPRVKQAESDQIVKALEAKQIPVTYVLFSDEGHGFQRPENKLAFDAVTEAFLAQCLGGPYLPVGDDFAGSTIAVPAGAKEITGIEEAVSAAKRP